MSLALELLEEAVDAVVAAGAGEVVQIVNVRWKNTRRFHVHRNQSGDTTDATVGWTVTQLHGEHPTSTVGETRQQNRAQRVSRQPSTRERCVRY